MNLHPVIAAREDKYKSQRVEKMYLIRLSPKDESIDYEYYCEALAYDAFDAENQAWRDIQHMVQYAPITKKRLEKAGLKTSDLKAEVVLL